MTKPKDPTGCMFVSVAVATVFLFLLWVGTRMLEFVALIKWVMT